MFIESPLDRILPDVDGAFPRWQTHRLKPVPLPAHTVLNSSSSALASFKSAVPVWVSGSCCAALLPMLTFPQLTLVGESDIVSVAAPQRPYKPRVEAAVC